MNPLDSLLQALQPKQNPNQQDIYPLGQGHGLPADIANFALNNLYQYGKSFAPANAQMQQLFQTAQQGRPDPQLLNSLMASVSGYVNPIAGVTMPGGKFFHGTPEAFNEFDPAMSKSSGLVGPGVSYLTNNPTVAADYAKGATHGIGPMTDEALTTYLKNNNYDLAHMKNFAPNIRPYQLAPHNAFVTDQPLGQADMDSMLRTLQTSLGTPTSGGFQKGSQAGRAANVQAAVRQQVGKPGQATFDTLTNMLGPERTNQILKQAGFQSIYYPGGALMGEIPHQAVNVLDPSIMTNLFDFLAGKTGAAK